MQGVELDVRSIHEAGKPLGNGGLARAGKADNRYPTWRLRTA